MSTFSARASAEITKVSKQYEEVEKESNATIELFAEEPSSMKIEEFLTLFVGFITKWKTAIDENEKARIAEIKKQEKEVRGSQSHWN